MWGRHLNHVFYSFIYINIYQYGTTTAVYINTITESLPENNFMSPILGTILLNTYNCD